MKLNIKSKQISITVVIFILLIFLHSISVLDPMESMIFKTFAPVQQKLYSYGLDFRLFINNVTYKKDAIESQLLKAQIRSLLVQNARLKLLGEENKVLKKELGFTRSHDFTLTPARVIGYDSLQNSTLLLVQIDDKTTKTEELKPNMPAITEDGIIIGKIRSINNEKIYIEPITSSRSAIGATILNYDYTSGIIEGELNLGIKMKMIPQTEKIKSGDLIITSGLEAEMPNGLLIGTVLKVSSDKQAPFQIAYINPLHDFKNLSKILIIKSY